LIKIVNLFDEFLNFYLKNKVQDKFNIWEKFYKEKYENLYLKLVEDLNKDNIDYKEIGKINLFDFERKINKLKEIKDNILKVYDEIYKIGKDYINFDFKIIIYIGLGISAGWATLFEKNLTILFDLIKIDELNWGSYKKIRGLSSHELSHLIHMNLRGDYEEFEKENDSIFLLYVEGFAQKFGEYFAKEDIWYMFKDEDLKWCKENQIFLKEEYFKRVKNCESVNDFFGDWYDIKGKKMVGYYLGYKFIEFLENHLNLINISKLNLKEINDYFLLFHLLH